METEAVVHAQRVWMRHCVLLAVLIAAHMPAQLHAQDESSRARVWIAGGLGSSVVRAGDEQGAFLAQIAYQKRGQQLTLRTVFLADVFGEGGNGAADIGVLYGRALTGRAGYVSINGGLAYTEVNDCANPGRYVCGGIGIPLSAEVAVRVLPVLGGGVQLFGNINDKSLFGGIVLFVQLGWMP
jgi:hypothetical protein